MIVPRPPATLAGSDGQVFDLLLRIIAIGRHRRTFRPIDVVRVAYDRLPHPHTLERQLAAERRRADAAEARLREIDPQPARIATLSALTASIFDEYRRGKWPWLIAAERGMNRSAVANHVARATAAIEADSPDHARWLVTRGVVRVEVKVRKSQRRRAA